MRPIFSQALIWITCMLFLCGCNTALLYKDVGMKTDVDIVGNDDGACFGPNTLVIMADGSHKKIIDIKLGDTVRSFDLESETTMNTKVIKLKRGFTGYHYIINNSLNVSPPHPFCTSDNKWVRIKDLRKGQAVRSNNSIIRISSIEHKIEGLRIYNIFVKENQNFFVSGDGKEFFLVRESR